MKWITALEKMKALGPETVVSRHKRPGGLDGVYNLDALIEYTRDFQGLTDCGVYDAKVLYERMMEKYGGRVNSHVLLSGYTGDVHQLVGFRLQLWHARDCGSHTRCRVTTQRYVGLTYVMERGEAGE